MTTTPSQPSANGAEPQAVGSRRHRRAFWAVAFAFLAVMALGTVPSPLYGVYRARDHFSLFMVTVAFAVYAVGVIGALLLAGHLSDLYGRRRLLLPSLGIAIVSAVVFLAWKSLPGLLVARLITGISIGIVASTGTAYLAELHAAGRPRAAAGRAQLTASAVNIGGLAVGAVVAGVLAQWVTHPLTVPYLMFLAALVLGLIGVALGPETREASKPRPHYRAQRLSVPHAERSRYFAAALSTFMAFAANGLFAGLAGLFLAVTLHHPSLALAGAVVSAMFAAGVVAQFLTVAWPVTRDFEAGMGGMVIGVALAVLAVWLHPPSLALFIAGGVLIGAGSGAIFKGAVGTVLSISPPERIAESLTGVFLAAYVGISLPVVGAGITLARHVSPKVTILGFAIAVTVGIVASAIKLLGRPTRLPWGRALPRPRRTPTTAPPAAPRSANELLPTPHNTRHHTQGGTNVRQPERDHDRQLSPHPHRSPAVGRVLGEIDQRGTARQQPRGTGVQREALDVPTILTTVGAEGGPLVDPSMRALADVFPDVTPIDRVSTNAWEDIREAVEATGRRTLLIAELSTEVCLTQTAISAMAEGYLVFFISDCAGGVSQEAHDDAKTRLVQAGATPINWMAIICEWTPDYTTDERQRVTPHVMKHGSTVGLSLEYIVAHGCAA